MTRWGSCDFLGLEELQRNLQMLEGSMDRYNTEIVQELAMRLLRKVKERTPVGDYSKGAIAKTYKRGNKNKGIMAGDVMKTKSGQTKYTNQKSVCFMTRGGKEVSFTAAINKVGGNLRRNWQVGEVLKAGNTYSVAVYNATEYAPYVEFGHKTRGGGYVNGRFMMTIGEQELNRDAEKIIERKLVKILEGAINNH